MRKKSMAVLLSAAMTASMLAGCGSSGQPQEAAQPQETTQPQGTSAAAMEPAEEFTYPMADGPKFTYWCDLNTVVSPNFSNLGETPFAKNWMAKQEQRLSSCIRR